MTSNKDNKRHCCCIAMFTLILSGDVELNPGPVYMEGQNMTYADAVQIGSKIEDTENVAYSKCYCPNGMLGFHSWKCVTIKKTWKHVSENNKRNETAIQAKYNKAVRNCQCPKRHIGIHKWQCAVNRTDNSIQDQVQKQTK